MSKLPSASKKKELSDRLEKLITELKQLNKSFAGIAKNSRQVIKKAHERKDEKAVHALRKKMGI